MDDQPIHARLQQLHAQLEQTPTIDDQTRADLKVLLNDIQTSLQKQDRALAPPAPSLRERLGKAALGFEVSHPHLTLALEEVANRLAEMGL